MPRVLIIPDYQECQAVETSLPLDELLRRIKRLETARLPVRKFQPLTDRQGQVLQGLLDGLTINQIALRLTLSPRTVRLHISCLKRRMHADTLAQLAARAVELGLTPRKPG